MSRKDLTCGCRSTTEPHEIMPLHPDELSACAKAGYCLLQIVWEGGIQYSSASGESCARAKKDRVESFNRHNFRKALRKILLISSGSRLTLCATLLICLLEALWQAKGEGQITQWQDGRWKEKHSIEESVSPGLKHTRRREMRPEARTARQR